MNTDVLQRVSSLVVESATRQGINLQAEFGTRERFQNFIIALTVKGVMDVGGLDLPAAYDLIMGDGSYRSLSDAVWDAMQKKLPF